MIRLWWEQAEGHTLKTRLICRNITRHRALRLYAHVQYRSRRAGEYLREGLPRPGLGEDVAVSPDILLHDEGAARQHETHLLHLLPGAEQA